MRAPFSFLKSAAPTTVPIIVGMTFAVIDPVSTTRRRVVQVNSSAGCTGIKAGGVAFTSFAIDDATHVSGIPGAHASGLVNVVVTNGAGDSTVGGTNLAEYWAPTTETLGTFHKEPNYTRTTGLDGVWVATVGTNLTQQGNPDPVASGGAPNCVAATDFPLGNAVAAATWAGAGDTTFFAVVDFASITTNSPTSYLNHGVMADASQFCGLFVRNNGGVFTAYFYEWDTAERVASVNITSLVSGTGAGHVILQGKKTGGNLYVRAIGATGTGTWTIGAACGALNASAGNLRAGGSGSVPNGIIRLLGAANTVGWSDPISSKFEQWAQAEHA